MLITEYYKTLDDGTVLNRTYSDIGMRVERDGVLYDEAIDPAELNREYTESNVPTEEISGDELMTMIEGVL